VFPRVVARTAGLRGDNEVRDVDRARHGGNNGSGGTPAVTSHKKALSSMSGSSAQKATMNVPSSQTPGPNDTRRHQTGLTGTSASAHQKKERKGVTNNKTQNSSLQRPSNQTYVSTGFTNISSSNKLQK